MPRLKTKKSTHHKLFLELCPVLALDIITQYLTAQDLWSLAQCNKYFYNYLISRHTLWCNLYNQYFPFHDLHINIKSSQSSAMSRFLHQYHHDYLPLKEMSKRHIFNLTKHCRESEVINSFKKASYINLHALLTACDENETTLLDWIKYYKLNNVLDYLYARYIKEIGIEKLTSKLLGISDPKSFLSYENSASHRLFLAIVFDQSVEEFDKLLHPRINLSAKKYRFVPDATSGFNECNSTFGNKKSSIVPVGTDLNIIEQKINKRQKSHGADLYAEIDAPGRLPHSSWGMTPLLYAMVCGNASTLELLVLEYIRRKESIDHCLANAHALFYAIRRRNINGLKVLIKYGAHFRTRYFCDVEWLLPIKGLDTLLHATIRMNDFDSTAVLLGYINSNDVNRDRMTPLHLATIQENQKLVALLLQNNATPNFKDQHGLTALMYATLIKDPNKRMQISKLLWSYSALVNRKCEAGVGALFYASTIAGNERLIRTLIGKGADLTLSLKKKSPLASTYDIGTSIWHLWIINGYTTLFLQYLDRLKSAGVNQLITHSGVTLLMLAAKYGNKRVLRELLALDTDIDYTDIYGKTALMCTTHADIAEMFTKQGANVNFKSPIRYTPLMYATIKNNPSMVAFLLSCGATPNIQITSQIILKDRRIVIVEEGDTAMHIAVRMNLLQIVKILAQHDSCDANIKNCKGKTAKYYAKNKHAKQLVQHPVTQDIRSQPSGQYKSSPASLLFKKPPCNTPTQLLTCSDQPHGQTISK